MRKIANYGDIERQGEQFGVLLRLFSEIKNIEEIEALLLILFTPSERAVISQRLAILRMIHKDFTYSEIAEKLKVSANTITRAVDGYQKHGDQNKLFNEQLGRFRFEEKRDIKVTYPNRGKIEKFSPGLKQLRREASHNPKDHNFS